MVNILLDIEAPSLLLVNNTFLLIIAKGLIALLHMLLDIGVCPSKRNVLLMVLTLIMQKEPVTMVHHQN